MRQLCIGYVRGSARRFVWKKVLRECGLRGSQEAEHVYLVAQDKDFVLFLVMICIIETRVKE